MCLTLARPASLRADVAPAEEKAEVIVYGGTPAGVMAAVAAAKRARSLARRSLTGRSEVCIGFRPSKAQATNTPVTIKHATGIAKLTVNQREETTPSTSVPVGEFTFKAGKSGSADITNPGADGRIAIDGVRWVWLGE